MAARRDDIGEIRRLLDAIRDAKAKRAYAEQELARKVAAHERQQRDADTAAARLTAARAEATETWPPGPPAGHPPPTLPVATPAIRRAALPVDGSELPDHLITTADIDALAEVLERPANRARPAWPRRTTAAPPTGRPRRSPRAGQPRRRALREARRRLTDLRAERDAIAAEQDDAPPASDLRPATRDARPGAPLWQLVRFAPEVPDETAAAIEGALYGAGLLTAWVHPDPALTRTALDAAEADGYLIPTAPGSAPGASPGAASGGAKTLADVLIAEDQEHVPADVIVAVLRSITLTDDIMASGSDIPARPVSRGIDYVFGYAPEPKAARSVASASQPLVSTKAQFSYGVHVGARPKQVPEYIGATNRANRRRARLAEQDERIATAAGQERELAARAERAADAARGLPPRPPRAPRHPAGREGGRGGRARQAALLARTREDVEITRATLDSAIAETDARTRQLRQAAAERRMPTDAADVDAIARAAAEFENAASDLHKERATLVRAEEDLAERAEAVERQRQEHARGRGRPRPGRARSRPPSTRSSARSRRRCRPTFSSVLEQIRQAERDSQDRAARVRAARRARPGRA